MKITSFPTASMIISSEMGDRLINGVINHHRGIDFAVNKAPVYAVADGEILKVGAAGNIGKMVAIKHNDGTISLYYHLDSFANDLKPGDRVTGDQQIGISGNGFPEAFKTDKDGNPIYDKDDNKLPKYGYHLHFGLLNGNQFLPKSNRSVEQALRDNALSSNLGFSESEASYDYLADRKKIDDRSNQYFPITINTNSNLFVEGDRRANEFIHNPSEKTQSNPNYDNIALHNSFIFIFSKTRSYQQITA